MVVTDRHDLAGIPKRPVIMTYRTRQQNLKLDLRLAEDE